MECVIFLCGWIVVKLFTLASDQSICRFGLYQRLRPPPACYADQPPRALRTLKELLRTLKELLRILQPDH